MMPYKNIKKQEKVNETRIYIINRIKKKKKKEKKKFQKSNDKSIKNLRTAVDFF